MTLSSRSEPRRRGRPNKIPPERLPELAARIAGGEPRATIAAELGVSVSGLGKALTDWRRKVRPAPAQATAPRPARLSAAEATRPFPFPAPKDGGTWVEPEPQEVEREQPEPLPAPLSAEQVVGLAEVAVGLLVRGIALRIRGRVDPAALEHASTFNAADRAKLLPGAELAAPTIGRWLGDQGETAGLWIFGTSLVVVALGKLGALRAAVEPDGEEIEVEDRGPTRFDQRAADQVSAMAP